MLKATLLIPIPVTLAQGKKWELLPGDDLYIDYNKLHIIV